MLITRLPATHSAAWQGQLMQSGQTPNLCFTSPGTKSEPDINETVNVLPEIAHQPINAADVPNNLLMPGKYKFDLCFIKDIPRS